MKLDNVSKSFAGRRVLNNLTYEFGKGITAITGPSGVGKSTLTGIMAGLIKPDAGYVLRGEGEMSIVFRGGAGRFENLGLLLSGELVLRRGQIGAG